MSDFLATFRRDIARLRAASTAHPVVNLVGVVGCGKTRLLAELGADATIDVAAPRFRAAFDGADGVVAVDGIHDGAAAGRISRAVRDGTRLVLASRVPIGAWANWEHAQPPVVRVTPWRDAEIAGLVAGRGLGTPAVRLAGGNPFLASELAAATARGATTEAAVADHVADAVIARLRTECSPATWRRALRVIASVGFGDADAVPDEDAFAAAARLSIVTRSGLGLAVREPFRTILDLSYRWRRPLEHRSTLTRASVHRVRMLAETGDPELRKDLLINGLFLTDEPHARAMLFPASPATPPVETAAPADADDLGRLLRAWAHGSDLDTHAVDRLADQWLPDSLRHFHLTRNAEGRPDGLAHLVPFDAAARGGIDAVAQQFAEPFTASGDGMFVITGYWPGAASGAALLHHILRAGIDHGRIVVCTPTPAYQRLALAIGLHPHGPARHTTFGRDHPIQVFSQRTSPEDLPVWVARVLAAAGHTRPPDFLAVELRRALEAIRDGAEPKRSALLAAPHLETEADLREWLVRAIAELASSDRRIDAEAGHALWRHYLDGRDAPGQHRGHGLAVLAERFRADGSALLGRTSTPDTARTMDDLTSALRALRIAAGSPSFAELARRVGELRAERGVPAPGRTPSRVTVYDCFRTGRHRLNVDLVVDLVRALGGSDVEVTRWRAAHGALAR